MQKEKHNLFQNPQRYVFVIHALSCLFLVLSILASYYSSLDGPFVFDTQYMMPESALMKWDPFISFMRLLNESRYIVGYSFGLNYHFFGMDPFWFRIVNVFIHSANTVLVYFILNKLFGIVLHEEDKIGMGFAPLLGAFLFGLNPVALYAVIYVIQRYILATTFFCLLAIYTYLHGLMKVQYSRLWRHTFWFYVAVFCYALAMRCKEHAVALPLVLICLTLLVGNINKGLVYRLIGPYLLFAVLGIHIIFTMKDIVGQVYEPFAKYAVSPINQHIFFDSEWNDRDLLVQSMFNQTALFFRYVYLWLVPDVSRMTLDLPLPFKTGFLLWPETFYTLLFFLYPLVGLFLLCKKRSKGLLGFGLLCPWILFATEFSTVRFHENFVLYRSYLWMTLSFSMVAFVIKVVSLKSSVKRIFLGLMICYCVVLLFALQHRLKPFKTRLNLWQDVVEKIDANDKRIPAAYRSFGNYAGELGQIKRYEEAFKYYQISSQLNPHYDKAWYGMAGVMLFEKRFKEAILYLQRAVKENPLLQEGYYWMGICYMHLGQWNEAVRNLELAVLAFQEEYMDARYYLARSLVGAGKLDAALVHYNEVIKKKPDRKDVIAERDLVWKKFRK